MTLFSWLSRHPLKGPSDMHRAQYTAEVMAKVKAETQPAPAPSPVRAWLPWPRLALTMATVAAGVLLMLTVTHPTSRRMSQLAQSQNTEDQSLNDTLQLLDQLDENAADDATGTSEEDVLQELKQLDDTELAASS